ncbi:4-hydroxythreonine-4-phosphate dehydrogenase PdxA, partial [Streptomyces sp. NPDC001940]
DANKGTQGLFGLVNMFSGGALLQITIFALGILGIEAGVNLTVGLPVIRTSVDHGTAFDIAGTGAAEAGSMVEALRQAAEMATAPVAPAA